MRDATLSESTALSMATEALLLHSSTSNLSDNDTYPFIVHSQQSVTNGDPPEVDNGKLVRKNRKRTSAEDQTLLEAEYKRNPKPDKAARMEIVKQVSLSEKEVQIWFQNRRQNTRRKSRPLLPHEIAAFGLGGMTVVPSDIILCKPACHDHGLGQPRTIFQPADFQIAKQDEAQNITDLSPKSLHESLSLSLPPTTGANLKLYPDPTKPSTITAKLVPDIPMPSKLSGTESFTLSQQYTPSIPVSATPGYFSNRRNARANSISTPSSQVYGSPADLGSVTITPPSCPESAIATNSVISTPSQVRLSLSLDGKAELVSSETSPPRPQRPRLLISASTASHGRIGLKRSQSAALPFVHVTQRLSSNIPAIPRLTSGRSRDSRTWEFCCDIDAKDELTTQAENESSGSAVAAISLLRSTSNNNLKTNINKRNAPVPKEDLKQGKRVKLGRAFSSLARLQPDGKKLTLSPSGDSDKENWQPDGVSGNARRHSRPAGRQQKKSHHRVLGELSTVAQHVSTLLEQEAMQHEFATTNAQNFDENDRKKDANPEVEKFMRGEVSPSKKGDLDCIQGLLSLSQGTWR